MYGDRSPRRRAAAAYSLRLGQDGRADGARDQREGEADDGDHGVVRGPKCGQREERDDDDREGEERLDDSRDRLVDETPEVAHHEPQGRAGHGAENRGQEGDRDDVPRSDEDAGEDVPAEAVSAEPVLRRRAWSVSVALVWSGSCGAISSPKIAQKTQKPTMRMPTRNVFERRRAARVSRCAELGGVDRKRASGSTEGVDAVMPRPSPSGRADSGAR